MLDLFVVSNERLFKKIWDTVNMVLHIWEFCPIFLTEKPNLKKLENS